MSCDEDRLRDALSSYGYPMGDPVAAAGHLGLSIALDRGPAEVGGLRVVAALDKGVIRVYERAIERMSEEREEARPLLRLVAVAHEAIHEVARRNRMEPDEPTVHRLALEWGEAYGGRQGGRVAPALTSPLAELRGNSPRE